MTRFEMEITGQLGEWWKKHAEQEVERAVKEADLNAVVEEDGAIKWRNNGNYLMDDLCDMLAWWGYAFDWAATKKEA